MNILAVAPYRELLPTMEEVAQQFPDACVTFTHGNLDEAFASALDFLHMDFDAVISRGGTAQVLEDEFSLPIISIELSAVDILMTLRDLETRGARIAAVGFESTLKNIPVAAEILGMAIDTFPIAFEDEIELALDDIAEGDYTLIVGDLVSRETAARRDMRVHLLRSGQDSVRGAFERAMLISSSTRRSLQTAHLLRDIIRNQGIRVAIYNTSGELAYTSLSEKEMPLLEDLARYAQQDAPPKRFIFRHDKTIFTVRALVQNTASERTVAFTITSQSVPGKDRFCGIEYRSPDDVDRMYHDSTYSLLGAGMELEPILRQAGADLRPVLLEGEAGSGKMQIARLLYLLSAYAGEPFIEVECDLLDDKSWEFLLRSYRSALYESGACIHFHGLHALAPARARELLGTIQRSLVADRSKLIFSASFDAKACTSEMARRFSEQLNCFGVAVPPLRRAHIPADAAERYLASLAHRDGRPAPTLDLDAATIVDAYHWPRNLFQFKQVLNWAYAAADEGIITAAAVREALNRDATARFATSTSTETGSMLDLLKPLSETTAEIARLVVESYGGNRTAAASTLGISRTTLWTMLKRSAAEAKR
ncbi:sigma54 specific transcriptional regulator, Fis family [Coriobacterium glomerans PW2]|uniref:Sigma54 specific transcriptional regulator, Fis family n=1 Tax=Coriobacterium glomerans (strain ATCC 49209 / DSM 20642 / JCM 10262 / PW2) TaxID=700015 RepID=F2NA51_CORGP|nr:sigma-54-dependent transcriptional regulator [Coriobacterium glomerans]AEB06445.1 sigma54 specific transcriptional regulator, Fis family [Coriobacterium glomerans PW2]